MYYSRLWLNKVSNKCVQQTREWAVVNFKSLSLTSIMLIITLIFFQEIQVCIIKLVIQCQQSPYPSYPIPFSSAECRQALYHVLLCFLLSNTPHVPSPINHAVKLFSGGLQDADLKVRVWGKTPGEKGLGVGREGVETGRKGVGTVGKGVETGREEVQTGRE